MFYKPSIKGSSFLYCTHIKINVITRLKVKNITASKISIEIKIKTQFTGNLFPLNNF